MSIPNPPIKLMGDAARSAVPQGPPFLSQKNRRDSLAHAIVQTVREPLIVLDHNLHILAASASFYRLLQIDRAQTLGRPFCELSSGRWDISALQHLLRDVISGGTIVEAYSLAVDLPIIGSRTMLLNARQVLDEDNADAALLVGLEDVTLQRATETIKDELQRQHEMLLLEVQHRVANSLQIIASILLLKARNVQSEEARAHLRDVHKRVISVATVQRQLQQSSLSSAVDIGPYLTALCQGLTNSMIADERAIVISANSTPCTVTSEHAVSLGLIVTELVINAIKHGFPERRPGHIAVDFVASGSAWRLSVSDDGVGREENGSGKAHVGLGTSIVEALARQLKADVEISTARPGAATAIVHAPSA